MEQMKKLGIGKFENQVRARTGGHVATLDPRSRTLSGGHPRGIPASRLTPPPSLLPLSPQPRRYGRSYRETIILRRTPLDSTTR